MVIQINKNVFKIVSNDVSIANSTKNYFDAKFIIGSFEPNANNDMVNKETIENWLPTLLHTHLVGNIDKNIYGEYDFRDHNLKEFTRVDENGNETKEYVLDTKGFGTCIKAEIETINGKDFIVATFRVFTRYVLASNLIKQRIASGTLYSSWEIGIKSYHNENNIRIIDDGEFLAHCVLGSDVLPACKDAQLLNVANKQNNIESLLCEDLLKEGGRMKKNKEVSVATNDDMNSTIDMDTNISNTSAGKSADVNCDTDNNNSDGNVSVASLTTDDIYIRLSKQIKQTICDYCYIEAIFPEEKLIWVKVCNENKKSKQFEYLQIQYEIVDDNVNIIGKPIEIELVASIKEQQTTIAELTERLEMANKSLETATASIKEQQDEIVSLRVFKQQVEEIEQEKVIAQQLEKQNVLTNKIISMCELSQEDINANESLASAIKSLDETVVNSFIIDSLLAKKQSQKETNVSTASVNTKVNINTQDEYTPNGSVFKSKF